MQQNMSTEGCKNINIEPQMKLPFQPTLSNVPLRGKLKDLGKY